MILYSYWLLRSRGKILFTKHALFQSISNIMAISEDFSHCTEVHSQHWNWVGGKEATLLFIFAS